MFLLKMPRPLKRTALFLLDLIIIPLAYLIALNVRVQDQTTYILHSDAVPQIVTVTLFGSIVVLVLGLPKIKLHAIESRAVARIGLAGMLMSVIAGLVGGMAAHADTAVISLLFGGVFFLIALGGRMFVLFSLLALRERELSRKPIAIYGAGSAGIRTASVLQTSFDFRPVMFVDDSPHIQGTIVSGIPVRAPAILKSMIERGRIRHVMIAIPSASVQRQEKVAAELKALGCMVNFAPSMEELVSNVVATPSAPVNPKDLIPRATINLDTPKVARAYADRVVMVTGAGGSIGSELCRQLLDRGVRRIVMFELSEYALYTVDQEIRPLADEQGIEVAARLGSVTDPIRLRQVLLDEEVEIVLHAAAYKHVPLVEDNEVPAAKNNVLGTVIAAQEAAAAGVSRFILVSTDKAVRPSSVMGATKRLAELAVQDIQSRVTGTKYAMVRFGNVLGSSGSVLPLFMHQISQGGPVTITHPKMERYFMTIPEAARLVLLAGAFAEGDEIFVLDMGDPVKIVDIAKRLITLSGHRVKTDTNNGDIEIQFIGMRPGEKLVEELVTDKRNLIATQNDKIFLANEPRVKPRVVQAALRRLEMAITDADNAAIRSILSETIPDFTGKAPDNVVVFEAAQVAKR